MNNYNNGDLYNMLLDRIRKDQKGTISPEEFEAFLRWRSLDHFSKTLAVEGIGKLNQESLSPFFEFHEPLSVTSDTGGYSVSLSTLPTGTTTGDDEHEYIDYDVAVLVNAWTAPSISYAAIVKVDLVSSAEFLDRVNNAITTPSATYPVAYLNKDKLWVFGPTTGFILLDYYRYPVAEYFDYYTDGNANVTYLTEGQSSYTLQAGEVARDGSTAGSSVTSASADTEWDDDDAMQILDMMVSDASIALSDPDSFQASILERKDNA